MPKYNRVCIKSLTVKGKQIIERGKEYATGPIRPDKTVVVYCSSAPFPVIPVKHFAGAVAL